MFKHTCTSDITVLYHCLCCIVFFKLLIETFIHSQKHHIRPTELSHSHETYYSKCQHVSFSFCKKKIFKVSYFVCMCFSLSLFRSFHLFAFVNRVRSDIRRQQKRRMRSVHRLVISATVAKVEMYRHIQTVLFSDWNVL